MNIFLVGGLLLWNGYSKLPKLDPNIHSDCVYSLFKKYASNPYYNLDLFNVYYMIVNDRKTMPSSG